MIVKLTCYGKTYLEADLTLRRAKRIANRHIRTCPVGAMPWARWIRWWQIDRPEYTAWSAVHRRPWERVGEALDHRIEAPKGRPV